MGTIQFQTDETQAAGFLIKERKSNLVLFFSALVDVEAGVVIGELGSWEFGF